MLSLTSGYFIGSSPRAILKRMDKIFSDVHTLLSIIAYSFYRFYIQSVNSQHFLLQKQQTKKGSRFHDPFFCM